MHPHTVLCKSCAFFSSPKNDSCDDSSCTFFSLLVECFTKYCVVREAIRHFRGLKNFEGGTQVLYNDGKYGDPLSLYLRALCREGMHI